VSNALVISNLAKTFDGTRVLDDINLEVRAGEVHGVVGENGSGKSTLVKILNGVHPADPGASAQLWGQNLPLSGRPTHGLGMATIHQDLALVDSMSVAENIGISVQFGTRALSPIRWRQERKIAGALLREFDLDVPVDTLVGELSPAERSIIAIVRALREIRRHRGGPNLLILDEPTAALPRSESSRLLSIIRGLTQAGSAVLFIGHRMGEVLDVCGRISVLRNGTLVATLNAADTSEQEVVHHMLGFDLGEFYPPKAPVTSEETRFEVTSLSGGPLEDVTFGVREGEILGITGLAGMGQDVLPYYLAGGLRRTSGTVRAMEATLDGTPQSAYRAGVVLVPGNRQRDAVWTEASAAENMTLAFVGQFSSAGLLGHRRERDFTRAQMERARVRPPAPRRMLAQFSGGNQQKLVLARTLHLKPRVLILHEPTQGVDAGAKKEILGLIRQAADAGTAVLLHSSDAEEVAEVSNRVLIMGYGRICAEVSDRQLSQDVLLVESQRAGGSRKVTQ
jgi:ribose transport system ATP-binding protein